MKLFTRRITGNKATDELWNTAELDDITVLNRDLSDQNIPTDKIPEYDFSTEDTPLSGYFKDGKFTIEGIVIPVYLNHVIRAITNIYPLDRYLAAHYERQLTEVLRRLGPQDADLLTSLSLRKEYDNTGSAGADAFLRFQKKLYLTYLREE
jgi:hypothetical protein